MVIDVAAPAVAPNPRVKKTKTPRQMRVRESLVAFQCKIVHSRYASDKFWEKWDRIHKIIGADLRRRREIQRLARREKDSIAFCRKIAPYLKDRWKEHPAKRWPRLTLPNVQGYRFLIDQNPDVLIHPQVYDDSWGKVPTGSEPAFKLFAETVSKRITWLVASLGRRPSAETVRMRKIYEDHQARGIKLTPTQLAREYRGKPFDTESLSGKDEKDELVQKAKAVLRRM